MRVRVGLSPDEVGRALRCVMPEGTYDTMQVVMCSPDVVEVKVRRASDGQWFQGMVARKDFAEAAAVGGDQP